ncbi:Gfo/Idh/MocA family protein [Naasia lichenicola]|uniref:Gfo/Idh/MocA family oxidoreductase n=1 Tax=Naasia lichenicola TaxID=2565933 RepID=A0A4S4FR93_9MICO|nr:Gfo/Idh/MocA family oxidoreductase [Naasia lichenicola]THG32818.1 Gfo/Idh/MocA family oxidoreductase [Naasia lichenicola]
MTTTKVLRVGIVGLEFGAEFIPIYQRHANAEMYAICQRTESKLDEVGDKYGIHVRYTDYDAMLADPNIDVIHINTPLQLHADQVVAALEAGKHVGCTIPMATSVEDCKRIVDAQRRTGLTYMMMETTLYTREFLFVQDLYRSGRLGKLQFLRSSHHQDMTGWPSYWDGMPPMYNATHAIGPTLGIAGHQAEYVQALGSGSVFDSMKGRYDSPYAIESTHIRFLGSDVGAEVTRHLWAVAREYRESFDVYGATRSFEWSQTEGGSHLMYLGEKVQPIEVPDFADRLPAEIQSFTRAGVYGEGDDVESHRSFVQGGGHGGSHPHLAHRLLMAVLGEETAYPDAVQAANITASGILSHASVMAGGERMYLPEWTLSDKEPLLVELDDAVQPAWKDETTVL